MLNEKQIELLPERIYQRLNKINTEYLEKIGAVIKDMGELRPSDVHKIQRMYEYGSDVDEIAKKLSDASAKNIEEIYECFDIVAKENYNYAKPFYKAKGKTFIPYEENESLQKYVKSLAKQTVDEYINLTQHTAFAVFSDKNGKSIAPLFDSSKNKVATSLSKTYSKVIDYAVTKVQTGVTDYNSAMQEVIKAIADSGIRTVDYATGYSRRLDTAVRQNVLWGIKRCNQNIADMVGEEFGADGYEISYHSHPRPSHAEMGGKQYAIGKARTINGVYYPSFSDVEGLLEEYNCLHFKFPILLGISQPAIDADELEELKADDNIKFEFEGKKYTKYEASQVQRKIETEIRHQKDRAIIAKSSGNRAVQEEAQLKINHLTSKYSQLSNACGLETKMERMRVKGFKSVKVDKILTNKYDSGIIKANEKLLRIPQVPSSDITKKINEGKYNTKLSKQNYLKHIPGTAQFKQYETDRASRGDNPQSILDITEAETQQIILEKSGTGIVDVTRAGKPRNVEYITLEKNIGYYYGGGKYHKTNKAAIHYGSKNSHLVPVKGDFYD